MRFAAVALLLTACGGNSPPPSTALWEIGPVISGQNYSKGEPLYTDGAIAINLQAQPHYVTRPGNLLGKSAIRLTFSVDGPLVGVGCTTPATVSAYFQKAGDDWNTDGGRWWATFASVTVDHAGDYSITAPLDGPWTSVHTMTAISDPQAFASAKANANSVGFTFGNCEGYGHGAFAAVPVKFVVTSFE